jgi:hypothetical protein
MRAVILAAAAALFSGFVAEASNMQKGVCIAVDIGLRGIEPGHCFGANGGQALLDAQVEDEEGKPLTLSIAQDRGASTVATCGAYIRAKSEGWTTGDARFDRVCDAAMMLSGAQPATTSHLRSGDGDLKDLARLTVLVLPQMGDIDPEAAPDMRSVEDLRKNGEVTVLEARDVPLALGFKGLRARYRELARGDIDNDGLEDLLVERETFDGAAAIYERLLLTRIEPQGLLLLNDSFGG